MIRQITDFLISIGIPGKYVPLAWTAGVMLASVAPLPVGLLAV